ncbi:uncharacterized protein A1O9_07247 [Exophiala aquamarina CBS 119918]|uniref:Bacteriophage T5 Orf172 DNA-binding domain-containing protein n=1 Tax=Exophiala aquamarina CBS 119918 TaxID=1182545 RepID=A0A072PBA8_9EURO|nr:uncharacterized protein A1O9_07247 [Exophiala aquamarina CBS 119918]KEF57057.1 hypothetical protein A1O9_07247 [Exophiala aquamarina CBS 119918]
MERDGLLIPLVQRWFDETSCHAATQQSMASGKDTGIDDLFSSLTITQPGNCSSSSDISFPLPQGVGSLSDPPWSDIPGSPSRIDVSQTPSDGQKRYDMRPREGNDFVSSIIGEMSNLSILQQPLSEFCPNISDPLARDSVWAKLSSPLERRDFETGALYIFERDGSPGHVKIGWTAVTIEARRKAWAMHGYEPRILFEILDVPYAQRVETLTHFELIKEWRQEVKCRAEECQVKHREWFEVTKDKAQQVLGDWAKFIIRAQPYNQDGSLDEKWRKIINVMEEKGDAITAASMLKNIDMSFVDESTLVDDSADLNSVQDVDHTDDLKDQTPFGKKVSDMSSEFLLARKLEKVSSRLRSSLVMSEGPFTQVALSQVAERQPLIKLTLEPECLPTSQSQVQTRKLASAPLREIPAVQAEQKPLPSLESLLNEGSSEMTNGQSTSQSLFAGKPTSQTTSRLRAETSKSTTNSPMGAGKNFFQLDSFSEREPPSGQSHSLSDPSEESVFQFGPPLKIEDKAPSPSSFQFGKTSLQLEMSPNKPSAPSKLQSTSSQYEGLLFSYGPPPKTDSAPPTSSMFRFGKPPISSTISFETKSLLSPSQLSNAPSEKAGFKIDLSSRSGTGAGAGAEAKFSMPSSFQPGGLAFQHALPQKSASATALQLLNTTRETSIFQFDTLSINERTSAESTSPTSRSSVDPLHRSRVRSPLFDEAAFPTIASPRTESPELAFQSVSPNKNAALDQGLRSSGLNFDKAGILAWQLSKTEPVSQQPQSEKTRQSPTEDTLFQFGSSCKTISPFKVQVPPALPSHLTRESTFQFGGLSTMEPVFKGKSVSTIQNDITGNQVFNFRALPKITQPHQPESTQLQIAKPPLFQFGVPNVSETLVKETHNWPISVVSSRAALALEGSENSVQVSQMISTSSTGHTPNSRNGREEVLVQGAIADKGISSPSEIPPPRGTALESDAVLTESEQGRPFLPPSSDLQKWVASTLSLHKGEPNPSLQEPFPDNSEESLSNRIGVALEAKQSGPCEQIARSEPVQQSPEIKSQNGSPTEEMETKNYDQGRGRITADDDAVTEEGVLDDEQTLVEITAPKVLERAASELVAQLSEAVST